MAKQSKAQKETVERVMHEFKHGELRTNGDGPKVKNPKQAVAIALSEAGASKNESKTENQKNLKRTKAKERREETAQAETEGKQASKGKSGGKEETKAALYAEAREKEIPGRSRMNKDELARALHH
ncbi:hypothetical protein SAMN05216548_109163 [Faunimonas pinastri]|uniref:Rho termination factor N-terminal domain-containing protein n=1 Tax=Faunimonas pinastri TaxID=1855383 RepID=A0A1H9KE06_9HYPH|nr:DUF6496 domain-containing protein [Faunimonas pinastri]SEQ97093.1 hypothetical protein SAMN05216548_109163 [Faunimonas pinastri]